MATIYGTSGRILPYAKRTSQPTAQIGKQPPKGYDVTKQPDGVHDTAAWIEQAQYERMRRDQPDPLTGKMTETGPAHLQPRWKARPRPPVGLGPEGAVPGEG